MRCACMFWCVRSCSSCLADILRSWGNMQDTEVETVMKRAGVGLLEAAEAMEKCSFQPRKALQMLDWQKRAREQAEKAEKKARDQVEADADEAGSGKQDDAGSGKLKNRGEPESKKKVGEEDAPDAADASASASAAAAGVERRPESAFPSRHSLASKEEEKEEVVEAKSKKKGKRGDTFGFEDLDQPSSKGSLGGAGPTNTGGLPERSPNQTPYGDFGGRKVFIGGTADKDEAELRAHFSQAFGMPHPPHTHSLPPLSHALPLPPAPASSAQEQPCCYLGQLLPSPLPTHPPTPCAVRVYARLCG